MGAGRRRRRAARGDDVRVALVHREVSLRASLARETVSVARGLAAAGVEVHLYSDPRRRELDLPGVVFHDVAGVDFGRQALSGSRLGFPLERATFALAATRAVRRERAAYDLVQVSGQAGWEHDVVRAHAVMAAEQRRWPERGGRTFRAARVRAALAPLLRPQAAVDRTVERLQFRPGRYARVLAVTDEVREDLQAVHGVPAERIDVVPYPVDTERFAGRNGRVLRGSLGLREDDRIALFVGHDFERKGLEEAIGSLAGLEGLHLVVVGEGDEARYSHLADGLGVGRRVHFVGATPEPERFFREADLFLLPTREDVWGISLVEAMAAGLPVVTTATAGAAGIVRSARAGVVLEQGSPEVLGPALRALLADSDGRSDMGRRGREAAAAYGEEAYSRTVLEIYERVVSERRGARSR